MSIKPTLPSDDPVYNRLSEALKRGQRVVYNTGTYEFEFYTRNEAKSLSQEKYITDLPRLIDKISSYITYYGISDTQRNTLEMAIEARKTKFENKSRFIISTRNRAKRNLAINQLEQLKSAIPKNVPSSAGSSLSTIGEFLLPKEVRVQQALSASANINQEQPDAIRQLVEMFDTERNFYSKIEGLNKLFQDPDFRNILKKSEAGRRSLSESEIMAIGNFKPLLRAIENYMLGLHEVNKHILKKEYEKALNKYAQLVKEQYTHYAHALSKATQAYCIFTPYLEKMKAAESAYRKQFKEKAAPIFKDQLSIADKAITGVQRGPRHRLFIDAIVAKETKSSELQECLRIIKTSNQKIDSIVGKFEDLSHTGQIQQSLLYLQDDDRWKDCLKKEGLNSRSLSNFITWYDLLGKHMAKLVLPIRALEDNPENQELREEIQDQLKTLQGVIKEEVHLVDYPTMHESIAFARALASYRENIQNDPDGSEKTERLKNTTTNYGEELASRIQTVSYWLDRYGKQQ